MSKAKSFTTYFGSSIQGMFITWGNDYESNKDIATAVLSMDIELNLHNVPQICTGATATDCIVPITWASATSTGFLSYFITFLNPESDKVVSLAYDCFMGVIAFNRVVKGAGSPATATVDGIQWRPVTTVATDWTATQAKLCAAPDTSTSTEYTPDATLADGNWKDCTEVIQYGTDNIQCAKIKMKYTRKFQLTGVATEDIKLNYRKYAV